MSLNTQPVLLIGFFSVAWPIREDLIPLFGYVFLSLLLHVLIVNTYVKSDISNNMPFSRTARLRSDSWCPTRQATWAARRSTLADAGNLTSAAYLGVCYLIGKHWSADSADRSGGPLLTLRIICCSDSRTQYSSAAFTSSSCSIIWHSTSRV